MVYLFSTFKWELKVLKFSNELFKRNEREVDFKTSILIVDIIHFNNFFL